MPAAAAAQTLEIPKRWPLVNQLQARSGIAPLTKDARLINAFAEWDPQDEAFWVYKRPGLSTFPFVIGTPGFGQGVYGFSGTPNFPIVLSIVGGVLKQTRAGAFGALATTVVASGIDTTSPYFFETINSNPQTVVMGNGLAAYVYTPTFPGTLSAAIAGGGFPAAFVTGWAYLNGTLYVMDTLGNIFGSNINDATTWNALNKIAASSNADLGVALAKQLSYVIALKQWTTQVFYDNGQNQPPPGSALAPVLDAQVAYGCFSGATVQSIDNNLLWVTSNQTVSPQVALMQNLSASIVSTPAVDRILDYITYFSSTTNPLINTGIFSWILKHEGHSLYGLTSTLLNLSLIYDIGQKLWYLWYDYQGNFWPVCAIHYLPPVQQANGSFKGAHVAQHLSNGNLYLLDGAGVYPSDYGNVFPVDIYTPNYDAGTTRPKYLGGLYPYSDRVPGSILQIRKSDDDYNNWSNWRYVDLSLKKPRSMKWGTFETRRAFHLRHQAATNFRIRDMDMQMSFGSR